MEFTWKKILAIAGFFVVLIVGPIWLLSTPMLEYYVKLVDREPERERSPKLLMKCADVCYHTMREDQAEKYYRKFYDMYEKDSRRHYALYWLAMSLDKQGKNKDAINTFQQYMNEYPEGKHVQDCNDGISRIKYTKPNN